MSIEKNYYVIGGYDLSNYKTDKFDDWKWTDEGEKYIYNHIKGKIQLFTDLMDGVYLYFGYIFASGDEYSFDTAKFTVEEFSAQNFPVYEWLTKLVGLGVIKEEALYKVTYKCIIFEEDV